MRKFYFILIAVFITVTGWSQVRKTWSGGSGAWTTAGSWSPSGVPASNDTVVFNTGSSVVISSVMSGGSITAGRFIVMGNSNVTLNATTSRTLTVANATGTDFTVESGSTLILGTGTNGITVSLANSATAAVDGTFTINTNRTYDANNFGNNTTVNGTLQNSGGTISTSGALTFSATGTYIHAINGGTVPTATWNAASTCSITGMNSAFPGGMTQTFGNLTFASNLTADVEIGQDLTCAGNLTLSNTNVAGADFRVTNGNTNRTITVGKKFTLTSGSFVVDHDNGGSTLDVSGDFEVSGGTLTEDGAGDGEVSFHGTTEQIFTKSGGTISGGLNFTVHSGAIVNFGTSVLSGSGDFTLISGGKVITANAAGLPATFANTGAKTYNSGADYEFRGAITGVFTTNPTTFTARNIVINNSSSFVTLSQPMAVTGTLSLQNGELRTTATNLITVNDNATASGTATSFVVGPIRKRGDDNFVFPTGRSGGGLIPVAIAALSTTSDFTAEHHAAPAASAGATITASGLARISACEYWVLTRVGTATANVTLYWNSFSNCNSSAYVTDLSTIVVAHSNGASWDAYKRDGGTTGSAISGTVTWNTVNTFSPFALGSTSAAANPLPVLFDNVRAFEKGTGVQIEWSNLTERDLLNYQVEHSVNGRDYTIINQQSPKNNQNDKADYTAFDAAPASGSNFYRIKVQEVAGKIIYSKILRVEIGNVKKSIALYPNPVSGNQITVALSGIKLGQYNVKVINASGQQVYQKALLSQGTSISQTLQLPSSVKTGIYTILVSGDDFMETKHFVVQ